MKIKIPASVYQKIRSYVDNISTEISGLGKIELTMDGDIIIRDAKIFKQKVTPTGTILDKNDLGKFYNRLMDEEGGLENWKLWWHSHAEMEVFFSGTDEQTIEDFDNETDHDNWLLSLVSNHAGDILFRLDIFQPIRLTFEKLEWEIIWEDVAADVLAIQEINEKIEKEKFLYVFKASEEDYTLNKKKRKNKSTNIKIIDLTND
jgi:hypothetical protein